MVDLNTALPIIEPLSVTVEGLMEFIKYLVGGIFGIYVISLIINIYFNRKFGARLKKIEKAIEELKLKLDKLSAKKENE